MAKNMKNTPEASRKRRQRRVRMTVRGTAERPRLSVFRSAKHIYAQIIDDASGKTLAAAGDASKKAAKAEGGDLKAKMASAFAVGKLIAEAGKKKGVDAVVFDRNGFAYTGRVAALAEGARSGGLKF